MTIRKMALPLFLVSLFGVPSGHTQGRHVGEAKDLNVKVDYFDYAYTLPNGEPVYYIGSTIRYRVTITNLSRRTYKNFQSKSTLRWVGNFSCQRWWYDNGTASYVDGQPLPGNSNSGLRSADMGKMGQSSYEALYPIPLSTCPGRGEVVIEGRHRNSSGRDEVSAFTIPINVHLKRKE